MLSLKKIIEMIIIPSFKKIVEGNGERERSPCSVLTLAPERGADFLSPSVAKPRHGCQQAEPPKIVVHH